MLVSPLSLQIMDQAMVPGEGMHFIQPSDSLSVAITRFATARVNRLVILNDDGTCAGILSLGEICRFLS